MTLSDPFKVSRTIRLKGISRDDERNLEGIIHIISDIKLFSFMKSWESYDLYRDNVALREKNDALEREIAKLKKDLG